MTRIINIFSPAWEVQDSYGRIATELANGFRLRGYHVNYFGDGAPSDSKLPATGGIFLGYPTDFDSYGYPMGQVGSRLAITMFESTKLPDGWSDALNRCQHVIVPASFLVDVFQDNGVDAPVSVVPLGITDEFLRNRKRSRGQKLTFLAIADRGHRKAWKKVAHAFVTAFEDSDKHELILKCRQGGVLDSFTIKNDNIHAIAEDYSNSQMAALYLSADVMIFPTCGEGFGLPPREFAATGGISLATNWGGTADDLREWGVPLSYNKIDAWADNPEWYQQMGKWASVDVNDLANTLRMVDSDFELFADDAINSAEFVRETYQWSHFVGAVADEWSKMMEVQHANAN